jgi:hypothetical protein
MAHTFSATKFPPLTSATKKILAPLERVILCSHTREGLAETDTADGDAYLI